MEDTDHLDLKEFQSSFLSPKPSV